MPEKTLLISKERIGSQNYISGINGIGWKINSNGDQEFQNIRIREQLQAQVFKKDSISTVSGSIFLQQNQQLLSDITTSQTTIQVVDNSLPQNGFPYYIRFKTYDTTLKEEIMKVTQYSAGNYTVQRQQLGTTQQQFKKDTVCLVVQNSIFINQNNSDSNQQYIDVLEKQTSPTNIQNLYKTKTRLGNLSGVSDQNFGSLSGYGFFSDNQYLKGKIYAGKAVLGNAITSNLTNVVIGDNTFNLSDKIFDGLKIDNDNYWLIDNSSDNTVGSIGSGILKWYNNNISLGNGQLVQNEDSIKMSASKINISSQMNLEQALQQNYNPIDDDTVQLFDYGQEDVTSRQNSQISDNVWSQIEQLKDSINFQVTARDESGNITKTTLKVDSNGLLVLEGTFSIKGEDGLIYQMGDTSQDTSFVGDKYSFVEAQDWSYWLWKIKTQNTGIFWQRVKNSKYVLNNDTQDNPDQLIFVKDNTAFSQVDFNDNLFLLKKLRISDLQTNNIDISQIQTNTLKIDGNNLITGSQTINGLSEFKGNTIIGNGTSQTLQIKQLLSSGIIPSNNNTYDIGSSTNKFKDQYFSGNIVANTFEGKFKTQRTVQLTGQVTGSQSFDGSQNVSIATTVNHTHTSQQISDQTDVNTANTIVKRDQSGNFSAGTITQQLSGNQSTATKLQTQRTVQLTGQVTGSQSFDGSQNISINTAVNHTHTSQQISDQTDANTASTIVKRDQSGNFSAGTITQQLSGNQSTATKLQTQRTVQLTGQVTGNQSFDGSQNVSIATTVNHTHTSQQIADQTDANTAGMIVKRDQSGNFSAGTITQQLSGNQSTATKLQTQRTVQLTGQVTGSQSFDGSQNASITTTLASHTHTSQQISDQTDANTASTIVKRDQSGNFNAGIITQQLDGKLSRTQNNVKVYNNVFSMGSNVTSITGTIKITLPKGFSSTMLKIKIDGYEYSGSSIGNSWSVVTGGYNYTNGQWIHYFAQIYGNAKFDKVRLGFDTSTSKCVILIGETTTVWNYPQINISEVLCSFSNYNGWDNDWTIEYVTDESTINTIYAPTISYLTNQQGNFIQNTKVIQPEIQISNSLTSLTKGWNNSLRVTTNYGYIEIGQQNANYQHFMTDKNEFYFNKNVWIEGNLRTNTITQQLSGNQSTATKLQTQRTVQLTGQITGSQSFDGSQDVSMATTLASHTHASQQISDQTNNNTSGTIVKRDQSGNFSAGVITQNEIDFVDQNTTISKNTNGSLEIKSNKIEFKKQSQTVAMLDGSTMYLGSETTTNNQVLTEQAGNNKYLSTTQSSTQIAGISRANLNYNGLTKQYIEYNAVEDSIDFCFN